MATNDIKQKLGETTEQLETKAQELFTTYSPYYTSLEPWQRGTLLIALTLFLLFSVYYLTKPSKNLTEKHQTKQEALAEEKLMRQMAFLKKLKE